MKSSAEALSGSNISQRLSLSLPPPQSEALNSMVEQTGLSKNELLRHAVALLNVAIGARKRGLHMALANDENVVVGQIISTF
jgi:hypothetical protein